MTVRIRIGKTIANEYVGRFPEDVPLQLHAAGWHVISLDEANVVLADAQFNADAKHGPEEMPSTVRRAYRGLAEQVGATLAARRR